MREVAKRYKLRFQFQTGSIKSNPLDVTGILKRLFQFQTGSIKRHLRSEC